MLARDGRTFETDRVVLAFGNFAPAVVPGADMRHRRFLDGLWDEKNLATIPNEASVLFVGSGLTMIDTVLALAAQGHHGSRWVLSRHGELRGADGRLSTQFFATSTLRRGERWESTAVPDLRVQSQELARRLI